MLTPQRNNTDKINQHPELFPIPSSCSEESFISFLNKGSLRRVKVTFTRNRVSMLSIISGRFGSTTIRMHEKFLEADKEIHSALKRYIRSRRRTDWKIVAEYARRISLKNEHKASTPTRQKTRGLCYDLDEIFHHVNRNFFNGQMKCRITWGQARAVRGRRRSIRYGSYVKTQNLIRIHPGLDSPNVPRAFVEYIVFHELLHAAVPSIKANGRNYDHGPAFRKLERSFPDLHKMHKLSKTLLSTV
ncbi:MAG: SprT-like domain-containing protein [Kiritimatiellae bacterium]|nr:SprT-like domain-containing protein [Kiritimatiellia bacterium]